MRLGCLLFSIVAGCLSVGCSGTRVVLVPDAEGVVGAVSVTTEGGERVLSQAGESTKVTSANATPSKPEKLSNDEIEGMFGVALANEPPSPIRYRVYFHFDSTSLTPDSKPTLRRAADDVRARTYCDVSVDGHADRAGDALVNKRLSLQRANSVKQALEGLGLSEDCLEVRYFGESDPVLPTPDGAPEPRNRRVEIEIR